MSDETMITEGATPTAPVVNEVAPPVTAETVAEQVAAPESPEAAKPVEVVPEKYEFKVADGVTLDPDLLGEFETTARELGLTNEKGQRIADIGVKLAQKFEARQAEAIETASADWSKATTADKEVGGDQATLDANLAVAKKALDTFGTPELRTLLRDSRLGNHPEVVRFMYRAGKALAEDKHVPGASAPAARESAAQRMYPNMNP